MALIKKKISYSMNNETITKKVEMIFLGCTISVKESIQPHFNNDQRFVI